MQGWLRCPPEADAGRGKSRVSSPRRSTRYPVGRRCPGAGRRRQPSLFEEADGEPSGPRLRAAPFRSIGQGCSVKRLSSTVQGVFHRLVVGEGCTGPGKRRWRRSLEPRACVGAVGMGLGVESSGGSGGLPWVLGSSFGVRVWGWPVESEYSTSVLIGSRGSCHIWGTWLDAAETDVEFSRRSGWFANHPYGGGESRLGRGCAFRRDGFLPPQERRMGGGSVGPPPARPFDSAQGERPHPTPGFRLGGGDDAYAKVS